MNPVSGSFGVQAYSAVSLALMLEAVCADTPLNLLPALLSLTDKNLVLHVESSGSAACFRLLETVRAYALEQLRANHEYEMAADRLANHMLALAEAAARAMDSSGQAVWMDRLESMHDHLRAALRWLIDSGQWGGWTAPGDRAAAVLGDARPRQRRPRLVRPLVGRCRIECFAVRARPGAERGRGDAGWDASRLCVGARSAPAALDLARRSVMRRAPPARCEGLAILRNTRGIVRAGQRTSIKRWRRVARTACEPNSRGRCWTWGSPPYSISIFRKSESRLGESVAIFEDSGDRRGAARAYFALGQLAFGQGDDDASAVYLKRSRSSFTEMNYG